LTGAAARGERAVAANETKGNAMIRLLGATAALALTLAATQASRAAEVTQTVTTTASAARVWSMIGKFEAIGTWLPGVASSPADHGSTVGSVRVITLKAPGNPTVTEKLTARHGHSYSYAITAVDPKVLPVSGYTSTISVAKAGAGSTVTWHGSFQPAGGADDAGAEKAVTGLYRSGLDSIKAMVEK
jgi:carbon monoxide dehydrogenase subunit G